MANQPLVILTDSLEKHVLTPHGEHGCPGS
jgi:hypothetical protein